MRSLTPFDPMKYATPGLPLHQVEEVKEVFDHIDLNKNGTLDLFEMKKAILDLGLDGRNALIKEIFWRLDNDMSREIDFAEFLEMMTSPMILGNDLT